MSQTQNRKIDSLQIIRGYAACLVAMCHIWNDGWLPGTFVELGGVGVDLFFVLSGFIMCLTVKLNKGSKFANAYLFFKKRVVRIFPIYLICTIPLILFVTKAEGMKSLYFYIGNMLLLPSFTDDPTYRLALPPGWTLVYELFFYYLFTVFLLFVSEKKRLLYMLIVALIGLVFIVQLFNLQGPQLSWVNFSYIIGDTMLINFALGMASYFIFEKYKDKFRIDIWKGIGLLVAFSLISMVFIYFGYPRFIANGIPAFFIILAFLFIDNRSIANSSLMSRLTFLGDASYSIYLTHFYFAFFKLKVIAFVGNFIVNQNLLVNLVDIVLLSLSITAGYLFYRWVEKPLIRYFSKRI